MSFGESKKQRFCVECQKKIPERGDQIVKMAKGWKCLPCAGREYLVVRTARQAAVRKGLSA